MFATTSISACDRLVLDRTRRVIAASIVILGLSFTSPAQADVNTQDILPILAHAPSPTPAVITFSNDIAVKQVLQRLVRKPDGSFDAPYATRLGFDLPLNVIEAAVQQASSLFPIAVFRTGLKRLQQYNPAVDDPLKLLAADSNWLINLPPPLPLVPVPARFLFAITVKDPVSGQQVVKSSVRVQAGWSPINPTSFDLAIERFGSSTLIRQVDKWRRNPNTTGPIVLEYFLVWIPALDRYYLGRLRNNDLLIRAIMDDREVELKEGDENVAKEVFRKLKDEALTINADDPDAPPR